MTSEKSNMSSDPITCAPKQRIISPAFHVPPLFLETNTPSNPITWAPKQRIIHPVTYVPPLFLEAKVKTR